MTHGSWKDFTSKWGFNEGASLEGRDFEARSKLVEMLNGNPTMRLSELRAVEYDRPGLHNCCIIVVLPNSQKPDKELLQLWFNQEISEQELPDDLDIDELVAAAYEE
jgi:hypothetical protein